MENHTGEWSSLEILKNFKERVWHECMEHVWMLVYFAFTAIRHTQSQTADWEQLEESKLYAGCPLHSIVPGTRRKQNEDQKENKTFSCE